MAACSSSGPKVEPEKSAPAPAAWEREGMDAPQEATFSSPPDTAAKPATPAAQDPLADLQAALKDQNDERMKLTAEAVLKRHQDHPVALNTLAMLHYRRARFDLAGYMLGKALQKDPQSPALHSNMGLVLLAQGKKTMALQSFRKALDLNPRDGQAAGNAGALYVMSKDYTKALIVLEVAYKQGVRDSKTLNNYAVALTAKGRGAEAKDLYKQAIKENAGSREMLLNYAILLIDHLGANDEGLETLNHLKFLGPPPESRERVSLLENKAKAGLK